MSSKRSTRDSGRRSSRPHNHRADSSSSQDSNSQSSTSGTSLDSEDQRRHARSKRQRNSEVDRDVDRRQRRIHDRADSDDSSDDRDDNRPRRSSRRHRSQKEASPKSNIVDELLMALGLARPKSQCPPTRDEEEKREERRSQLRQAVQAALTAGAVEAWQTHKKDVPTSEKALRVLLAAGAAGGIDTFVQRHSNGESKFAGIAESVIGGMATTQTFGKRVAPVPGGPGGAAAHGAIKAASGKLIEQGRKRSSKLRRKFTDD